MKLHFFKIQNKKTYKKKNILQANGDYSTLSKAGERQEFIFDELAIKSPATTASEAMLQTILMPLLNSLQKQEVFKQKIGTRPAIQELSILASSVHIIGATALLQLTLTDSKPSVKPPFKIEGPQR